MEKKILKVAILDLNDGHPNQAMGCFRNIVANFGTNQNVEIQKDEFDVRQKAALPNLDYDVYISSGGPGSPFEGVGQEWENKYFDWLNAVYLHNLAAPANQKKYVFLICHSFQMASRFFEIGQVCLRKSTSFGVMPVHKTFEGKAEFIYKNLPDPFFVVENRNWQVIQPDEDRLNELGAKVLILEKKRPHIKLERAIMSIRFSPEIIGTQFHPEADAAGMRQYMLQDEKKEHVINEHGIEKYESMIEQLEDEDKIMLTQATILPTFLRFALEQKYLPLNQNDKTYGTTIKGTV